MKLQQGEHHDIPKVARLNKILFFVFLVGSVKVSLLVGLLLFPASLPDFKALNLEGFILDNVANKEIKLTEQEQKALARINALNNTSNENNTKNANNSQKIEEELNNNTVAKNTNTINSNTQAEKTNKITERPTTITGSKSIFAPKQAYAAENIPPSPDPAVAKPNASPLVPQVAPRQSPIAAEQFQRPDTNSPTHFPSPNVNNPYLPTDTASIKAEEYNRREQELRALEQQTQARIKEMRAIEGQLQSTVGNAQAQEDEKINHLIEVYSNMKPRQAAQVLAGLDEKVAVKVLSKMDGKKAGSILSYMEAGRAVVLSELLAKVAY